MRTAFALVCFLLVSTAAVAQQPVVKWADVASYGTAAVNPTVAAVEAARGPDKWCHLGQLGISELLLNTTVLTMKHFIVSPRPCIGCGVDGMPSGHFANSLIGNSWNRSLGFTVSFATADLRYEAHRHTKTQLLVGGLLGAGADWAGPKLLHCPSH